MLGSKEASERILLHQGEDAALSQVEGCRGKVDQVPQSYVFGEIVDVDLKRKEQRGFYRYKDCEEIILNLGFRASFNYRCVQNDHEDKLKWVRSHT